jgi:PAS domain S-box-containing protein
LKDKPINILCIENTDSDYELIVTELKNSHFPFKVERAKTKSEFQHHLANGRPDIVICQDRLPGFSAVEVLDLIGTEEVDIPVVLVTPVLAEKEARDLLSRGLSDFISKDQLVRLPFAMYKAIALRNKSREKEILIKALKRRKNKSYPLISRIREGLILCDDRLMITYVNPAFTRITGWLPQDVLGVELLNLINPEEKQQVENVTHSIQARHDMPHPVQFSLISRHGKMVWFDGTMNNLLGESGLNSIVLLVEDITSRQTSEDDLFRTESILRSIIDHSEIGYILIDRHYKLVSFNHQAAALYHLLFSRSLCTGTTMNYLIPGLDANALKEIYFNVLTGKPYQCEAYSASGSEKEWFSFKAIPVRDQQSDIFGIVVAFENISERKKVQLRSERITAEALKHNKNLEQITYIISHNLRSPTIHILSLLSLLQQHQGLSLTERDRCFAGLAQSAARINETITDLNKLVSQRSDQQSPKELVNFSRLLDETLEHFQDKIRDREIVVERNFEVETYLCTASYMHSIFYNLVSNSIKYSRLDAKPSFIKISSSLIGMNLCLSFVDNGLGFDMKSVGDKVFNLYAKFHPDIEGKGMGLHMVKSQTELMEGNVTLQSEAGRGSRFTLIFPL